MNLIEQLEPRRLIALAAAATVAAVALLASFALGARPAGSAEGAKPEVCPDAEEPADESPTVELRRSIRCLINQERAVRGHSKLRRSPDLQDAAQRHARIMVETGCLAHRCGEEPDLEERVRDSGYLEGADAWRYAENTGCGASANAMAANWMASRFHRINILERKYDDIGVGVVHKRVPGRCEKGYATFAVVFGWRTPPG